MAKEEALKIGKAADFLSAVHIRRDFPIFRRIHPKPQLNILMTGMLQKKF